MKATERAKEGRRWIDILLPSALVKWLRMRRLNARRRRIEDEFGRDVQEAKRNKKSEEAIHSIYAEWRWERDEIEWEIGVAVTQVLMDEAHTLHIPLPPFTDETKWVRYPPGTIHLSTEGIQEVRAAIRREKQERREAVRQWLTIRASLITIITGLVGALIGLVAVFRSK